MDQQMTNEHHISLPMVGDVWGNAGQEAFCIVWITNKGNPVLRDSPCGDSIQDAYECNLLQLRDKVYDYKSGKFRMDCKPYALKYYAEQNAEKLKEKFS